MDNMQRSCPKGHLYDSSLPSCPYCLPGQSGGAGATAPVNSSYGGGYQGGVGATAPANNQYGGGYQGGVGATAPANNQYGGGYQGSVGPTAPVNRVPSQEKTTFIGDLADPNSTPAPPPPPTRVRPVVGWLVCVQGPDIGKDFRLHTDFNHVGRAEDQDVCLSDSTVSREHFTVSYDRLNNHYFADMGKGSSMVYINGYSLGGRTVLKKGDQIKVGDNTLLVFIPLEQKDVKWNWKV